MANKGNTVIRLKGRYIPDPKITKLDPTPPKKPERNIEYIPLTPKERRRKKKMDARGIAIMVSAIAPIEFCFLFAGVMLMDYYSWWLGLTIASFSWFCLVMWVNLKDEGKSRPRRPTKRRLKKGTTSMKGEAFTSASVAQEKRRVK